MCACVNRRCNPMTLGLQVSSRCADMMRGASFSSLLHPCSHSEISTYFMCVLKYLHQSACLHLSLQPCARPCFLQQHRSNVSTARKSTHPSVSNCFYFSLLLHSCFSLPPLPVSVECTATPARRRYISRSVVTGHRVWTETFQ